MASPRTVDLDVQFNRPQFDAFQTIRNRTTVFCGWGRGVGKSFFHQSTTWLTVAQYDGKLRTEAPIPFRGVRIVMLMPTLVQFKDVHWSGIERDLLPGGQWGFLGARLDRQRGQVNFPGGSWFKPFPAEAHSSKHARGMRCDRLLSDEIDDIEAEVYDSIAVPLLSEPWSLGQEMLTGTPTRGRHGLWYRMREAGRLGAALRAGKIPASEVLRMPQTQAIMSVFTAISAEDWPAHLPQDREAAALQVLENFHSFEATYKDVPETVSPLAVARARATSTQSTFEREWESNPDAGEGLVYSFDEDFHVREVPQGFEFHEYIVGADHGYEDPGVFLLIGIHGTGADAIAWVLNEIYMPGQVLDWWQEQWFSWSESRDPECIWNRRALLRSPPPTGFMDRSRPDTIAAYTKLGINALPAENAILPGVARVANQLAIRQHESGERYSKLYVRPCCTSLRWEFGRYRRRPDPSAPGRYLEAILDRHNHAMDALRYALFMRFGPLEGGKHLVPR